MAAVIDICEDMKYNLAQCRYVSLLLLLLLLVDYSNRYFAMAIRSKIYALCFRSAGKNTYHD
jgi:hypothetical protein